MVESRSMVWGAPRPSPSRPGPCQQLAAHPVQLADMAPPETAQEGSQGGWRLDRAAQGAGGSPSAQHVGVVNAVASSQRRRHQGYHLVAGVGSTRGIAQVEALLDEFTQTQVLGEGHRKDQPNISHQAVVVEGDLDSVGMVKWQHLLGAPGLGWGLCFQNHYPRSTGALSYPFSTPRHSSFRWIGGKSGYAGSRR